MRRLLPLLVLVALVFGASYAAALINRVLGPWNATAVEQDGSVTRTQFGPDLPRPSWVPVYPGAWVVQASNVVSARAPSGFHMLELGTRASADEVRRFYTRALADAGFKVEDLGTQSLDPATAALLGVAGTIAGRRAATDDRIEVQIRAADGLLASRLLQIHWHKISEYPAAGMPRSASSGGS
jgi:hypothetical protein